MQIDVLSFLYLVIALGLIPIFVLLSMILWRLYKNMDRIDNILRLTEQMIEFTRHIDQLPAIVANKFMSKINNFFR